MRILIAQQQGAEQSIAGLLHRHRYTTECVQTTQDVLDWAQSGEWDCLVLDDRLGGLDPVRRLRANRCSLPILLLTGSTDARSRVRALDAGADDCFSRPFYPDELVARVRALTRRQGEFVPDQLATGDLLLDRRSFRLCCRDRWVRLGNREFQLIELLARHQGQFLSTEQLMDQIWGCSSGAEISVVWTNISYLRRRLKQIGSSARIILSRGRGYLLECP